MAKTKKQREEELQELLDRVNVGGEGADIPFEIAPTSGFERDLDGSVKVKQGEEPPRPPVPINTDERMQAVFGAVERGLTAGLAAAPFPQSMATSAAIGGGLGLLGGPVTQRERNINLGEAGAAAVGNTLTRGQGGFLRRAARVAGETLGAKAGGADNTEALAFTSIPSAGGETLGILGDAVSRGRRADSPDTRNLQRLRDVRDQYWPEHGLPFTAEAGFGQQALEMARLAPGGREQFRKASQAINELGLTALTDGRFLRNVPLDPSTGLATPSVKKVMERSLGRILLNNRVPQTWKAQIRKALRITPKDSSKLVDPADFLKVFDGSNKNIGTARYLMGQLDTPERELLEQAVLWEEVLSPALARSDFGAKVDLSGGTVNITPRGRTEELLLDTKRLRTSYGRFNEQKAIAVFGEERWKTLGKIVDALAEYDVVRDVDPEVLEAPARYLGQKMEFQVFGGPSGIATLVKGAAGLPLLIGIATMTKMGLANPRLGRGLARVLELGASSTSIDTALTELMEMIGQDDRFSLLLVGDQESPAFVVADADQSVDELYKDERTPREQAGAFRRQHRDELSLRRGPQLNALRSFFGR